jgi:hypothetical protein
MAACNNGDAGTKANNQPDSASNTTSSGNSAETHSKDSSTVNPDDTAMAGGESVYPVKESDSIKYCYIKKFYSKDNQQYVDADFIQVYTGDKAIKVARQHHDVEMTVANGDTTWSLPSDLYIVNENSLIRKLIIADDAMYKGVKYGTEQVVTKPVSREQLLAVYNKEKIYVLTINKNNVITQIKEQYLP